MDWRKSSYSSNGGADCVETASASGTVLVRDTADRDTLTYLRLADSVPTRELAVIRHLQRYQSRGAEQFLALLREQARTSASPFAP